MRSELAGRRLEESSTDLPLHAPSTCPRWPPHLGAQRIRDDCRQAFNGSVNHLPSHLVNARLLDEGHFRDFGQRHPQRASGATSTPNRRLSPCEHHCGGVAPDLGRGNHPNREGVPGSENRNHRDLYRPATGRELTKFRVARHSHDLEVIARPGTSVRQGAHDFREGRTSSISSVTSAPHALRVVEGPLCRVAVHPSPPRGEKDRDQGCDCGCDCGSQAYGVPERFGFGRRHLGDHGLTLRVRAPKGGTLSCTRLPRRMGSALLTPCPRQLGEDAEAGMRRVSVLWRPSPGGACRTPTPTSRGAVSSSPIPSRGCREAQFTHVVA